jgi:long-chain acyl-CoA synthetase
MGCGAIADREDFGWDDEVFLSFLPLSHAYEHTGGQFLPIALGAQIYYAEGLEKLAVQHRGSAPDDHGRGAAPVRGAARAHHEAGRKAGPRRQCYLMDRALEIGARPRASAGCATADGPDPRTHRLRPRSAQRFGGRIKAMVSGGAPLNPDVGNVLRRAGPHHAARLWPDRGGPGHHRCNRPKSGLAMDTVGPPLKGVEVRIAEDGEILVRGELVMHGYWRNPDETTRVLQSGRTRNGWLHTGDIGQFDEKPAASSSPIARRT